MKRYRTGLAEGNDVPWPASSFTHEVYDTESADRYPPLAVCATPAEARAVAAVLNALHAVAQAAGRLRDARTEWNEATRNAARSGVEPVGRTWTSELQATLDAEAAALELELQRIDAAEGDAWAALDAALDAARDAGLL